MSKQGQSGFAAREFQTAVNHFQSGNLQQAEAILKRIPGNPEAAFLLGLIYNREGKYALAIDSLKRAIALKPTPSDFHSQLGMAYAQSEQLDEAVASFRKAVALQPNHPQLHNNLGTALKEQGKLDEAAAAFENAIRLKPDYALAYNNLGNVLHARGQLDLAAQCLNNALALNPDYVDARNNLGDVLEQQGKLDDAAACYQAVLARGATDLRALNNLGNVYRTQGKFNEAESLFLKALDLDPSTAETHSNLGFTYFNQGKLAEAADCFRRAIALKPGLAIAHRNLGAALNGLGQYDDALDAVRKALEFSPQDSDAYSTLLFISQFSQKVSQAELLVEHLRFAKRFEAPLKPAWCKHDNIRDPAKRLKIGYVSADFRSHAVAAFIEPVLANHDRSQFEIFCYYNHAQRDKVTERINALVEHWVPCVGLNDDQLTERIRADGIDVVIDLSGHTAGNRMLALARKPAPVQITYLGYPSTSGLSAMDYRITDVYADPPGSEAWYREQLLRLPDSLCVYHPVTAMPKVTALPALENGYVTFGSFNNSNKIDTNTITLWAKILSALPSSRLLMLTVPEGERRESIARQFEQAGVKRSRIDFHGKLPSQDFHAMLTHADIALDPLLITGGTTTCESLWMGVPVVVLSGQRFIHRVGFSFLSSAGLAQYAAATPEDYIKTALDAASNLPRLADLRRSLRDRLQASPLMDPVRFTRHFEHALRHAWQRWCEGSD